MISLLSSTALKPTLDLVLPLFEARTGQKVQAEFGPSARLKALLATATEADLAILTKPDVLDLIEKHKLKEEPAWDLASSTLGLAVRRGSMHPDISTMNAFKETLLHARSIGLSNPDGGGASGKHMHNVLRKLEVLDTLQNRIVYAKGGLGGLVGDMLRSGAVDVGVQQIPELSSVPEIDVVGALPLELQLRTVFTAALTTSSTSKPAALLGQYLSSVEVARVLERYEMSPINPRDDVTPN